MNSQMMNQIGINQNYQTFSDLDSIINMIAMIITATCIAFLPGDNVFLNSMIGSLIGIIINSLYRYMKNNIKSKHFNNLKKFFGFEKVYINVKPDDINNYRLITNFILEKFPDKVSKWGKVKESTRDNNDKDNKNNEYVSTSISKYNNYIPLELLNEIVYKFKDSKIIIDLNDEIYNIVLNNSSINIWTDFIEHLRETLFVESDNIIQITIQRDTSEVIYTEYLRYIRLNYSNKIINTDVSMGEDNITLNPVDIGLIKEEFKGKNIMITIPSKTCIKLVSNGLTGEDICDYIKSKIDLKGNLKPGLLRVHETMIEKMDKKSSYIYWNSIVTLSCKNKNNLIVSKDVQENIFDDIEWFMKNENWYLEKGIPYKRGFILYGKPGTGKTSIIKTLAAHYGIDVFIFDIDSIKTNNDLIKLFSKIKNKKKGKHYILAFEDFDKSTFLFDKNNKTYDRYGYETKNEDKSIKKLTMSCLINLIDGIVEPYGQILFMTGNEENRILKHEALVRPGRIDKIVEVDFCCYEQIEKMFQKFYELADDIDLSKHITQNINKHKLSPAKVINVFMKYPDDFIKAINELNIKFNESKKTLKKQVDNNNDDFNGENDEISYPVGTIKKTRFKKYPSYKNKRCNRKKINKPKTKKLIEKNKPKFKPRCISGLRTPLNNYNNYYKRYGNQLAELNNKLLLAKENKKIETDEIDIKIEKINIQIKESKIKNRKLLLNNKIKIKDTIIKYNSEKLFPQIRKFNKEKLRRVETKVYDIPIVVEINLKPLHIELLKRVKKAE